MNVDHVVSCLRSADGDVRNEVGYNPLARAILNRELDETSAIDLGSRVSTWFSEDGMVHGKSFAALVLACLAERGLHRDSWADEFAQWWVTEPNTIGLDPELGWLHAVAHGADYVGALGEQGLLESRTLLDWCATRMTYDNAGQGTAVWVAQEGIRLGEAIGAVLSRPGAEDPGDWLEPVEAAAKFRQPAPIPAKHTNTVQTLSAVVVALVRRTDRTPLQDQTIRRLVDLLSPPSP